MQKITKSQIFVGPENNEEMYIQCYICKIKTKEHAMYCNTCEEAMCESCARKHRTRKMFRNHYIEIVTCNPHKDKKTCDPCEQNNEVTKAEKWCEQCGEYLCETCSLHHRVLNITKEHELIILESEASQPGPRTKDKFEEDRTVKQHQKDRPGKPMLISLLADSITLEWDPVTELKDNDYYQISFKDLGHGKWRIYAGEFAAATAELKDLKSNTAFKFRVRVIYENREGPFSSESDEILTLESMASQIVKSAIKIKDEYKSTNIYALPMTEVTFARNESAKIRKFEIGYKNSKDCQARTIFLVGATGIGKSTMVDGIVNYTLGVKWDDPFRFSVTDLLQGTDNSYVKTAAYKEWLTVYTIYPQTGSRLMYQLNIIDTPGLRGACEIKRNQQIVKQIGQLFSEKQPKGVAFIDAVCVLFKAPDARVTADQNYIFKTVMSLFGKDIESNICSLVTFADGVDPPVLAALKASGLPFGKCFTFNNSISFATHVDKGAKGLSEMFWKMGINSYRSLFKHLENMEAKSLLLTNEVINERLKLDTITANLLPQIIAGKSKMVCLKNEFCWIRNLEMDVECNENFEYEIEESILKQTALPDGKHDVTCVRCYFDCEQNCSVTYDNDVSECSIIDSSGHCKVCPKRCHWSMHKKNKFRIKNELVKKKKTYSEMEQKYKKAKEKLLLHKTNLKEIGKELNALCILTDDMIDMFRKCNERIEDLALLPNALSKTENYDLMIGNEEIQRKEGFKERIKTLNQLRERNEISSRFEQFRTEAQSALNEYNKYRSTNLFSTQ